MNAEIAAQDLIRWFSNLDYCVVAFSGGVDSSVVAKAAHLAIGNRAKAVTADSPSLGRRDLETARKVATEIGIEHRVVQTNELARPGYVANDGNRCFHCKSELYDHLKSIRNEFRDGVIVNGANLDDLGDHRPGMIAAKNANVLSPLIECNIDKSTLRQIAKLWSLPVWDRPASPCLSSRVAYGVEVTPERLQMVELAENYLRDLGLHDLRVRYHDGDLARVEVPVDKIELIVAQEKRQPMVDRLTQIGFKFVTIDLSGLRSGSLNQLIDLTVGNS